MLGLAALGEALEAGNSTTSEGATALEVVGDILDLVATARLRREHPGVWAWLRLLALIDDDGVSLANLGNLVGNAQTYLSGLVTGPGYAQAFQDYSALILGAIGTGLSFLPPKGRPRDRFADDFRSEVLYGWTPAGATDHPNLMQVLGRTLTWRVEAEGATADASTETDDVGDITIALVPREHNDGSWGVFLRAGGAFSITQRLGYGPPDPVTGQVTNPSGWQLTVGSTDPAVLEILAATNGFVRASTSDASISVALERPDDVSGSWIIGNSTGSHLEIQHAKIAASISQSGDDTVLDVGASADHVILNIELGSDSFLSAVLPPSLRLDSKIGLGVNTQMGFYLTGGVALVVDLPVNLTVGVDGVIGMTLQALHLRIGFTTPTPQPTSPDSATFTVGFTIDASVQVAGGVFKATVAGIGMEYDLKQITGDPSGATGTTAGRWQPALNFVPPNGIGVAVNAAAISGGGFIGYDAASGEYTGALQLHLGLGPIGLDITALAMLDTKIPGYDGDWALLVLLAVQFSPAIQLGFGFTLSGVGGILGINHTIDSDAIAAGLRTKALDAILFPPDPVGQAPHIFSVWRQTMPISVGHTVVGPMFQFSWGTDSLCTLELAVLIELDPNPVQIVLLGSFRFAAPSVDVPLVQFRADIIGVLTFDPVAFTLQAALVDSKLGTFTISGGLVLVARGGDDGTFVLSVGGFHPQYTPPANVPVPDRIRVDISGTDNPRLRLEAYLAITSQSFQFGARVELHAAAGPLALDGWLGLDVLIQWLPHFRFSAEISAGLSLSYDGSPVLEVSIDVLLEGPGPWHVKGSASLTLLFFTLTLPIDASWGEDSGPTASTAQPLTLVQTALSAPDAWSASMPAGTSTIVVLSPPTGDVVPAHPLATLSCHQRVVPLGMQITHVGQQPLSAPMTVDIQSISLASVVATDATEVDDAFAAGQFIDLTDDQALSRPSFEQMRAGLGAGGSAVDSGNATAVATTYKTVMVDGAATTTRPRWMLALDHADAVLRPAAPTPARPFPLVMSTVPDTLRHVAGDPTATTATLAAQNAGGRRLLDAVGVAGAAS